MNYYIQGDAAKAEKIKAAFKELGYDVTGFDMCNDNILFFTYKLQTGANVISTTNAHLYTANIIKTHPDYKELELTIEPKFKVGDKVIYGGKERTLTFTFIDDKFYNFDGGCAGCRIELQDELLRPTPKSHYGISNFHAGMPVLVRDCDEHKWLYTLFGIYNKDNSLYPFVVVNMRGYAQCIPFNKKTKHLLGTSDMPSEEYINW